MRVNDGSIRVSGEVERHRAGHARNERNGMVTCSLARLNTRGGRAGPDGCASVYGGGGEGGPRHRVGAVNVLKVMNMRWGGGRRRESSGQRKSGRGSCASANRDWACQPASQPLHRPPWRLETRLTRWRATRHAESSGGHRRLLSETGAGSGSSKYLNSTCGSTTR